ncbi:MAG: hypothetical protein KJ065_19260 [Anaerolineae bacterium]|nr:hypothetical protein [Anaerolineae bacterium]
MSTPSRLWMVRPGFRYALVNDVYKQNAIAIGWPEVGNLSKLKTRDEFRSIYDATHLNENPNRSSVMVSQLYRFVCEIMLQDYLITFIRPEDEYLVGIVETSYIYTPTLFSQDYPHVRRVHWLDKIPRKTLSSAANASFGSIMTVFSVDVHLKEVLKRLET